jgi:hypothetical protein
MFLQAQIIEFFHDHLRQILSFSQTQGSTALTQSLCLEKIEIALIFCIRMKLHALELGLFGSCDKLVAPLACAKGEA